MSEKPYWWPKLFDAAECQRCREDYEEAADMDDESVRDEYNDGCKYSQCWDHTGDAYSDYEPLADAFLAQVSLLQEIRMHFAIQSSDIAMMFCNKINKLIEEPTHD